MIRHGENGKGITSRWYPQTLKRRIDAIHEIRAKLDFVQGDGLKVIDSNANSESTAFFIDPPYTAGGKRAGSRLYTHSELDHEELFKKASSAKGDVLMTYDNADAVVELAKRWGFETEPIAMKSTHHAKMTELLIGKDLSWVRDMRKYGVTKDMFDNSIST